MLKNLVYCRSANLIKWKLGIRFLGYRQEKTENLLCTCNQAILNQGHILSCQEFEEDWQISLEHLKSAGISWNKAQVEEFLTGPSMGIPGIGTSTRDRLQIANLVETVIAENVKTGINRRKKEEIFVCTLPEDESLVETIRERIQERFKKVDNG